MSEHRDEDVLDPELRSILADAKARDAVDSAYGADAEARVLARVESAVTEPSRSGSSGLIGRAGILILSVGLVTAVAASQLFGGHETPAPAAPDAKTTIASSPEVAAPASDPAVPTMHIDELPTAATPPARVAPAASASGTSLAEEYRLVEGARAKLAAKDYAGALRAIREHDQRFASGQLNQECESVHIQMLVETGHIAEARDRARSFRARFPSGLLVPSVARAIAESDADATP